MFSIDCQKLYMFRVFYHFQNIMSKVYDASSAIPAHGAQRSVVITPNHFKIVSRMIFKGKYSIRTNAKTPVAEQFYFLHIRNIERAISIIYHYEIIAGTVVFIKLLHFDIILYFLKCYNTHTMNQVSDLMNKNSVSVSLEMSIMEAVQILSKFKLKGAPVINSERVVLGILTEGDFLIKDTNLHLPTFLRLFEQFGLYKKDKSLIKKELAPILSLRIKDIMSAEGVNLKPTMSIEQAASIFTKYQAVDLIPVVDDLGKLAGVLSRSDFMKFYVSGKFLPPDAISFVSERKVDKNINNFLLSLNKTFIFVSKRRIRFWLIFSIFCLIIGFFIANAFLIRIEFK